MKKLASLLLVALLVPSFTSCGTLFFSQRQKAAHSERLDPNILILDAVGLIFWIIPGLVAYGVDFYTGAIYLPPDVKKGEGPFIKDEAGEKAEKAESTEKQN